MACFRPLEAWRDDFGRIRFDGRASDRPLQLPCGRCIGCRQVRQRSWALRCLHEARTSPASCFVTLTYDDKHVPRSLRYVDFQDFMHRVRAEWRRIHDFKTGPSVRFFVCGEYGELNWRPHFHALLFGWRPSDGVRIGERIFQSRVLDRLWSMGYASFGSVEYDSAAYCAGYVLKKVTGPKAAAHYERADFETGEIYRLEPEFARMSLKPGLGSAWFKKYWRDVYLTRDGVCLPGGKVVPAPRYYDNLLAREEPWRASDVEVSRFERSKEFASELESDRLAVREACAIARSKLKERYL